MEDYPREVQEFEEGSKPVVSSEVLSSPDWRNVLEWYEYSGDPWEVSVRDTARGFRQELERMEGDNLELSGRMVLTCAVILRAKAEGLSAEGGSVAEEEVEEGLGDGYWGYEEFDSENYIPDLEVPLKRIQQRTVSRNELSEAFSSAIEVHERRKERRENVEEDVSPDWGMDLEDQGSFRVKLQRLYRKVKNKLSQGKRVLFSRLLSENSREEKFQKFMELLHLQSEGKIKCKQEKPFSEIKVELAEEGGATGREDE
ncbi:MAG: segregation/condensation protein A [Candidatus Bipolaricaulota bacterium]